MPRQRQTARMTRGRPAPRLALATRAAPANNSRRDPDVRHIWANIPSRREKFKQRKLLTTTVVAPMVENDQCEYSVENVVYFREVYRSDEAQNVNLVFEIMKSQTDYDFISSIIAVVPGLEYCEFPLAEALVFILPDQPTISDFDWYLHYAMNMIRSLINI